MGVTSLIKAEVEPGAVVNIDYSSLFHILCIYCVYTVYSHSAVLLLMSPTHTISVQMYVFLNLIIVLHSVSGQ